MKTPSGVLICLAIAAGCGNDGGAAASSGRPAQAVADDHPATASAPSEPEPEPEQVGTEAEPPSVAPEPPTPAQRARQQALRGEARRMVRDGNLAGAVERMEALVELAPRSPSVLCEAGYIAHRAENDMAEPWLRQGMSAFAASPNQDASRTRTLARCEYNLGLVYQRRQYLDRAERYFMDSLHHRDNDVVRERLRAVRAEIEAWEHAVVSDTIDDMVEELEDPGTASDGGCQWVGERLAQEALGRQNAGFIEVAATDCYMTGGGVLYFAYGPAEEVTAYLVDQFEEDDSDAAASNASVWTDFSLAREGTGDEGYWRARFTSTERHSVYEEVLPPSGADDPPVCDYAGSATATSEHLVICAAGSGRCAHIVLSRSLVRTEGSIECSGSDPVPEWALAQMGLSSESDGETPQSIVGHRVAVSFEDERVRVRTIEGTPSPNDAPPDGDTTIEALLADANLAARRVRD